MTTTAQIIPMPQGSGKAPRFSVVVPCWNAAATLPETLASLRAQTQQDFEVLLIDDGSTDETPALIDRAVAADPRFRGLRNRGKGPSAARNMAGDLARGDILAFCDADDVFEPWKLALIDAVFEDARVDATFGQVRFWDGERARSSSSVPGGDLSIPMLLGENPVCTMSNVSIRRASFKRTGGFDTDLVHNEDLEWLIRLVGEGMVMRPVPVRLVRYRTSCTGLSANLAAMRAGREAALRTARRYGFCPAPKDEAVHLRYLARRALRTGAAGAQALALTLAALRISPRGYFSDPRRGLLTALGALIAPVLPSWLRRNFFAS